ncbi:hypothetical protein [Laspinema olomoucense]|uniref:Uncharacterized protein n=1 Tax=Laspinema olomoucense D3b TaxID=2953688 RepID=A0ABT2NGG0_9CYAN|nr:hypothetical protein [Laspinema sp. D3b]MCT7981601.1 hypothetical protein [Laspinema sp. D3b]
MPIQGISYGLTLALGVAIGMSMADMPNDLYVKNLEQKNTDRGSQINSLSSQLESCQKRNDSILSDIQGRINVWSRGESSTD